MLVSVRIFFVSHVEEKNTFAFRMPPDTSWLKAAKSGANKVSSPSGLGYISRPAFGGWEALECWLANWPNPLW